MTWIKIDDRYPEDPETIAVGEDAAWLNLVAISYCARNHTDGRLPKSIVPRLTAKRSPMGLAKKLVNIGWWVEEGSMFFIRSYLKWQRSAEQVENERRTARERMEKLRKNKSRSSPDVPLTEVDTDSETPQVDTHSSSSSTTVDDDVDEEIVEKYKPVARLFDREGFHPVDVAVALRRYDLRRQGFGAPVSDAEGWLRKVLESMATTRSAEPGESKTIQLPDGEYMEFRDGMWVEAEAVS